MTKTVTAMGNASVAGAGVPLDTRETPVKTVINPFSSSLPYFQLSVPSSVREMVFSLREPVSAGTALKERYALLLPNNKVLIGVRPQVKLV